jgi:4-diphosphocytidyl-2-C-methyl-D-erythritol kinase
MIPAPDPDVPPGPVQTPNLPLRAFAPAKINLGLFLGPHRPDTRHELVSVMQSISLADELTLEEAPGASGDEVLCPGVPGENLAALALASFREATAWDAPPLRLTIDKRIPMAAGLGGGSADAAAALRLAHVASGLGDEGLLFVLASKLGADVPAQVTPGRYLASGAGEVLEALPDPVSPFGLLVLPQAAMLSTAEVYAAADRLGLAREASALQERRLAFKAAFELGTALPADTRLLHNDLQAAAIDLCPEIKPALRRASEAGAELALVSGSGPTVLGLFARANGSVRAERAAAGLAGLEPAPVTATPVGPGFGAVQQVRT